MHPYGGQTTATLAFDPDAYDQVLRELAHAWEDRDRDDDRSVADETDQ
jgi:hypothetical protein